MNEPIFKEKGTVEPHYNWLESRDAFEAFRLIYTLKDLNIPEISLTELSKMLQVEKNTASQRVSAFSKTGLIKSKFKNREKVFWIDKEKLSEMFKEFNQPMIDELILSSIVRNFAALLQQAKSKKKKEEFFGEPFNETGTVLYWTKKPE